MNQLLKKLVIGALIIIGLMLLTHLFSNEKKQIEKTLFSLKKAVESKNLIKSLSYISKEYTDDNNFDFQTLAYIGQETFKNYTDISIEIDNLDISLDTQTKQKALVILNAKILGKNPSEASENLLGFKNSSRFKVDFIKTNNSWKIIHSQNIPN